MCKTVFWGGRRMISLSGVNKRLGSFRLKDISIEIPDGYICALVGQNASGKTTLIKMILGLCRPDDGTVVIDGLNYQEAESDKRIRDITGIVPVNELMNSGLSLLENGRCYGRFYSRYDESIYMEYLERFGLDRKIKFGKLSKGQKIKSQFAFALSTDPKYLILDEPTANFDPDFKQDFLNVIMQFMESGKKSVIIASHILDELDRIVDYLIYLDKGELVYSGDIESFRDKYRILSGESYKVKLLKQEDIIHAEDRKYGTKALVVNHGYSKYDGALTVTVPTLEEFMYHYSKRGESVI